MGLCVADICDMRGSDWLLNMVPKNLGRNNPSVLNILNMYHHDQCCDTSYGSERYGDDSCFRARDVTADQYRYK